MKRPARVVGRAKWYAWVTAVAGFLLLSPFLLGTAIRRGRADGDRGRGLTVKAALEPAVHLAAGSGQTIPFKPNNGRAIGDTKPEAYELPLLVLYRNGRLTAPAERTLAISLSGIRVPFPGVTVNLSVTTVHGNPDPGQNHGSPIIIWRETRWIPAGATQVQDGVRVTFTRTFTESVSQDRGTLATPTDYFRYELTVIAAGGSDGRPRERWSETHAFLMENQWTATLPGARTAEGAPAGVRIHYCDMFPFRQDIRRPTTWIPRADVTEFVRSQLIPGVREVFRTESEEWGFAWHHDWISYRSDRDGELISIALTDGRTWFHSRAPVRWNAGISINVNGGRAEYEQLVDGLISTLYHELFHNLQRDIYQHQGGNGDVEGYQHRWSFFSEGTAVLASAVGQQRIQFGAQRGRRAYLAKAAAFLGSERTLESELNISYRYLPSSYAALYWRFLYEQCGDMHDGIEDTASGMGAIRRILESVYSAKVIDIASPVDFVEALPTVMDNALNDLAKTSCPFGTYRESLIGFSRAIYLLRLENGRCREPGLPIGCGFYDPQGLYPRPPADVISYAGEPAVHGQKEQLYPAGIPNSYGIDLIEVELDSAIDGQSVMIELQTDPAAAAELHAELGVLRGTGPGRPPAMVGAFEPLAQGSTDGLLSVAIPRIELRQWDRLALIITRLDSAEAIDHQGAYTLVLKPGVDS